MNRTLRKVYLFPPLTNAREEEAKDEEEEDFQEEEVDQEAPQVKS